MMPGTLAIFFLDFTFFTGRLPAAMLTTLSLLTSAVTGLLPILPTSCLPFWCNFVPRAAWPSWWCWFLASAIPPPATRLRAITALRSARRLNMKTPVNTVINFPRLVIQTDGVGPAGRTVSVRLLNVPGYPPERACQLADNARAHFLVRPISREHWGKPSFVMCLCPFVRVGFRSAGDGQARLWLRERVH